MDKTIKVSVIGGSGYAGGELLRLLSNHPNVRVAHAFSETYAGKSVSAAFPGFKFSNLIFESLEEIQSVKDSDIVFSARETGAAMKVVPELLAGGQKVIDLAADFRLKNPAEFASWYKSGHTCPEYLEEAVYGLPEINRAKISVARIVANPGCYPTASILSLCPLVKSGLISVKSIIIDAKSGVSGAGRGKATGELLFSEINENFKAYAAGGVHRHIPEIEQALCDVAGSSFKVSFTPHLVPMTRGILATCYAELTSVVTAKSLYDLYMAEYGSEPFISVLDPGSLPQTKSTLGSNQCHIGISLDSRTNRVIVTAAIDNLVKGAAGQAVQNMNIMSGLKETTGLTMQGLWP